VRPALGAGSTTAGDPRLKELKTRVPCLKLIFRIKCSQRYIKHVTCFEQHSPQRRGVHATTNRQPRASGQHQLQYRLGRAILRSRAAFHQSEPHRPSFLESFTPSVKGAFRQRLFPAELFDGRPAAPLRRDSFGPLVCFRVGRLRLNDSVAHDTTIRRSPARHQERFTRRLRKNGKPA
jgi:hypothetical protein